MTSKLAHTYSIIAIDPEAGEMGAAVQSHWFSVGSVVPWAEPGAGVVVTQSFVNPAFGPKGLEKLRMGISPSDIVSELTTEDEGRELRQLAILNPSGEVEAFTGPRCIQQAGHLVGENYSVQANMMLRSTVWPAMARAFESTPGRLAERLVAALVAAEGEGGDFRGRQSASLLVVRTRPTGKVWDDRLVDLRVEDHHEPVEELSRLLKVHRAYEHMNRGDVALEGGKVGEALDEYSAAERLYPENEEMAYWTAVSLANSGQLDDALPLFSKAFQRNPNWRDATPQIAANGHLKVSPPELATILGLGRVASSE